MVWSNTTISNVNKLQKVPNFGARIISNPRKYDNITPVLKNLKWLPVKTHLFYRDLILAFKCICRGDVNKRNTRNS